MLDVITPVIITCNEEANILRTMEKLAWAQEVLVVDSFSDDSTVELVNSFSQARLVQREFDTFAGQCNHAIENCDIRTEWVLNLDADYVLTDELIDELRQLKPDTSVSGYRARFVYCINGRRIRSGIYPPVTVLFRKQDARFVTDGHAHRVVVDGEIEDLNSVILHDDRKPLRRWLRSQITYTALEADKLRSTNPVLLSWTDRIRRWRIVAPPAMVVYCLMVRGGVLDGLPGVYYAFQRALAELMLSLYLFERPAAIGSLEESYTEMSVDHDATSDEAFTEPRLSPD